MPQNEENALVQHSAGGVVFRRRGNAVEIAMIQDSYGRWTFPKGHVEANESLEEAAKREISEEIGIDEFRLSTRLELGEMDYWFTSTYKSDLLASQKNPASAGKDGVLIHKYVTYYLFETDPEADLIPQEKEVAAVDWVPLQEMDERNEYDDNRDLIKRAKGYLTTFS